MQTNTYLDNNMLDIETYRRGIGLFKQGSINYKCTEEVFTNPSVTTMLI